MKIGDFARLCGTRISILQHYDKVGVLRPMYTDRFTNYRYYDPSQALVFERIRQLKAGQRRGKGRIKAGQRQDKGRAKAG